MALLSTDFLLKKTEREGMPISALESEEDDSSVDSAPSSTFIPNVIDNVRVPPKISKAADLGAVFEDGDGFESPDDEESKKDAGRLWAGQSNILVAVRVRPLLKHDRTQKVRLTHVRKRFALLTDLL
jgi:hypothetical protein